MKPKLLLIAIAMWTSQDGMAQENVQKFTLKQCVEYALANNNEVKNATLDEYIAQYKVGEYSGTGLPQLSGSAAVQHAKPLRAIYMQNSPASPFYNQNPADIGKIVAIPNFFQLPNTVDASVTLSQLIFSSSFFYGLRAAKTYKELASVSKEVTKVKVVENVTKAYYLTLINLERKNLFDVNITRLDSLLKQTIALQKSGFAEKLDVDRLEVTYNNLLTERNNFDNLLSISGLLLKYQMNMPLNDELVLIDKLEDLRIDSSQVVNSKADYNNRLEYKLLKRQRQFNQLTYKGTAYSSLPSLGFTANLGYFTQSPDFNFSHGFSHYGTYSLGLNVPIFTGFVKVKKTQQAKLNVKKTENNIEQFEKTIDLQVASAEVSFKNSIQMLGSQKRNMDLAKEVARVTKIKYKAGTGSNLEVVTAESSLKEAQINYYNALYNALVAKVDFDLALGNLY